MRQGSVSDSAFSLSRVTVFRHWRWRLRDLHQAVELGRHPVFPENCSLCPVSVDAKYRRASKTYKLCMRVLYLCECGTLFSCTQSRNCVRFGVV